MIKYPTTSPYATTKQNSGFIQITNHRNIYRHKDDVEIIIDMKYHNRIDLLSYDLYGSSDYWWVLYSRNLNSIKHPIWDFNAGKSIWIPSNEHVKNTVG